MGARLVFVDVDTQIDFMLPQGALYVPGAEEIIPNLRALMTCARHHGVPVISSADAHPPNDPSFAQWPPHCVIGTPGAQRIPETQFLAPSRLPNRLISFPPSMDFEGQTIVEKTAYDVLANPNFDPLLERLAPTRAVVFGVATEYCIRSSALSLRGRRIPVDLVVDAIKGITPDESKKAIQEMTGAGVRLVKTEEVLAEIGCAGTTASISGFQDRQ